MLNRPTSALVSTFVAQVVLACLVFGANPKLAVAEEAWAAYVEAGIDAQWHGRLDEAERVLLKAAKEAERFGVTDRRLWYTLGALGRLYYDRCEDDVASGCKTYFKKAERYYKQAIALCEVAEGPDSFEVARVLGGLADLYKWRAVLSQTCLYHEAGPVDDASRIAERRSAIKEQEDKWCGQAATRYEQALTITRNVVLHWNVEDDESAFLTRAVAGVFAEDWLSGLAATIVVGGRRRVLDEEHLEKHRRLVDRQSLEMIEALEKGFGADDSSLGSVLSDFAGRQEAQGRLQTAERYRRRSLVICRANAPRLLEGGHEFLGKVECMCGLKLEKLAELLLRVGGFTEAEALGRELLACGTFEADGRLILAKAYAAQKKIAQFDEIISSSLDSFRLHDLFLYFYRQEDRAFAGRVAVEMLKDEGGGMLLVWVGRRLCDLGDYVTADLVTSRLIQLQTKLEGRPNPGLLEEHAQILRKLDRTDDALKLERRAERIRAGQE